MASSLSQRLARRIRAEGPLRFDDFQEAALYDPEGGYYERLDRVGRQGDFVTGASWHPAFARCLVRVLERVRDALGDESVDLVDVGAGEGEFLRFAADTGFRGEVRLVGVEASARRRAAAALRVPEARFVSTIDELADGIRGLVLAYELMDALPVRALLVDAEGRLVERRVGCSDGDGFSWQASPCPDAELLLASLERRGVTLEAGQLLEVRPGAARLARALADRLEAGLVLLFDYGAPARALYGPARPNGTLEAFRRHEVTRDVLAEPGSRDVTAWVDFTEIEEEWKRSGLSVRGPFSQSRVLLSAGILTELDVDSPGCRPSPERVAERNAIAKLFAPGGMGESIRVLAGERGEGLAEAMFVERNV